MPRCPFAIWRPISGSSGSHTGGPFKIVHHTTEGSTAEGAMETFKKNRSDPHFTVDGTNIFQHIDTGEGARALRNNPGGVQTNRDSAVQIELVGFAHKPKDPDALKNLARLCRWIEDVHGVPRVWPNGPPRPARNGKDPGGHNRDAETWEKQSGHYGHCHVPENTHWDPAYTASEVDFIMAATSGATGSLPAAITSTRRRAQKSARGQSRARAAVSTMPDHAVGESGFGAYIGRLALQPAVTLEPPLARRTATKPTGAKRTRAARRTRSVANASPEANVDVGSLVSYVNGVSAAEKDDILYCVQLAQRAASGAYDRFNETQAWYGKYVQILENVGWTIDQFAFSHFEQRESEFRMDQAALSIITAIATQNQLAVLQQSISALSKLSEGDGTIRLFDFHSSVEASGNFQLGAVQRSPNGALSMALGAFYFRAVDHRKRFLFFKWGQQEVNFWTAAQRMTLNTAFYERRRNDVIAKLEADAAEFIADLKL